MGKLSIEVYEEDWYKFIEYMKLLGTHDEQIGFHMLMQLLKEVQDEEGQA